MTLANPFVSDYHSISEAFLALHERDGFSRLPPSPLLHPSVPMSFVMSAGLIQVENDLDRIVSETGGKFTFTQPCFRHFDLEQVGSDPTRLSLFHMPAAFYIGSSQRENILPRLWFFLTGILKLSPDNLWITYLDDPELGRDDATYECWRALDIEETHLLGMDQEHCFWRQRALGKIASDGKKCGPHTEIFYERKEIACPQCEAEPIQSAITCRCGRFVEISNSLFIENYLDEAGKRIPADMVFSECVVGLERIAMILENATDVYHISRFQPWRESLPPSANVLAHNIMVEHLSAFSKLVEDGAPAPGHGGRARIIRVLARRIMTQALLIDLDILTVIAKMEQGSAQSYLRAEYGKFLVTLRKAKGAMRFWLRQGKGCLSIEDKKRLQSEYGRPFVLIEKYES